MLPIETTAITCILAHEPLPGGNLTDVGHIFDLTAVYLSTGQPARIAPGHIYTITVQYTNTETDKIMESALGLYYWDDSQWVEEPTSAVDMEHNTVTATPNHFSRWAVLAEMWQIYLPLVTKTR